jgi:hypothetical protein
MKWSLTLPFRLPVDPVRDNAPGYFEIIQNPMDLSTVKKKLSEHRYESVQAFVSDLHLIWDNALVFNGPESMFAFMATDLKKWTEKQWRIKPVSQEDEWQKRLETLVERLHDHMARAPPLFIPPTWTSENEK